MCGGEVPAVLFHFHLLIRRSRFTKCFPISVFALNHPSPGYHLFIFWLHQSLYVTFLPLLFSSSSSVCLSCINDFHLPSFIKEGVFSPVDGMPVLGVPTGIQHTFWVPENSLPVVKILPKPSPIISVSPSHSVLVSYRQAFTFRTPPEEVGDV